MSDILAAGVCWDLSDLYASSEDPKLSQDFKMLEEKSLDFENQYKPLFEKLTPSSGLPLFELLEDYKQIISAMSRIGSFAHLYFASKTNDASRGAFLQKIQTLLTDLHSHMLFFEVCWNRLDEKTVNRLISDPRLKNDLHFLKNMRRYAPHTLSEGEEKIMAAKSNISGSAFSRLFDEVVNGISFYINDNGKRVKKTEGEVLSLLHSPEREVRKNASDSLAEGLDANTHLLTYIYNMILADHRLSLKIRRYEHPIDSRNLANEIDRPSVFNLIETVKKNYPLAARYYRLKRRLLGLDKLYDYDRYTPVDLRDEKIPFSECKKIVLEGYYAFSEEAGRIAQMFFDKSWIDAEVREGKQGGGFCCATTDDLHPYILVNYTGSARDVMTVAHELGHGIHQYLARKVGILEMDAPLTMAETASVFGEMLIFEKILQDQKDPQKRLALICGKIDDNFSTVFRQIALTDFELKAHEAGLTEGELPHEKLSGFWMEANTSLYGDSITLTENYRHGWKYIPHFVHSPFYCYAYAYAQIFVLSLFQKYQEGKKAFLPKYFEMLSLGGSKAPEEIAKIAGLDIHSADFWQSGLSILEKLVTEAENLAETSVARIL